MTAMELKKLEELIRENEKLKRTIKKLKKQLKNKRLDNDFLWGSAICANQCEGAYKENGRGLSVNDVMTVGSKDKKREIDDRGFRREECREK